MADICYEDKAPRIPYAGLAGQLFDSSRRQKVIPFLGAGASLSDAPGVAPAPPAAVPSATQLDGVYRALGLQTPGARLLMQIASRIARQLESTATGGADQADPVARLSSKPWPPSAGELAEAFAHLSSYETFEEAIERVATLLEGDASAADRAQVRRVLEAVASVTGLASPTAPLLAVSSYYEYRFEHKELADKLRQIFAGKQTPTQTHRLIARAAAYFMGRNPLSDYLIVTTNYDCLMEHALEKAETPFCVLTVDRHDRKVYTRFGPVRTYLGLDDREYADLLARHQGQKFPSQFSFEKPRPLVVVYKMHGCLHDELRGDSVVISDEDYVDYIYRMADNQGAVPAAITPLLEDKAFLFLGYRFADWNVRTIYRRVVDRRSAPDNIRDFAVMRELSVYEEGFFGKRRISVLKTDLASFVRGIEQHVPPDAPPPHGSAQPPH